MKVKKKKIINQVKKYRMYKILNHSFLHPHHLPNFPQKCLQLECQQIELTSWQKSETTK